MKNNCTNCGKEIKGMGILSPTTDKKRTNQCLLCASGWDNAISMANAINKGMKNKQIKKLIERIYSRGFHDGIDITRGNKDRFFGNTDQRLKWEEEQLNNFYKEIKLIVTK